MKRDEQSREEIQRKKDAQNQNYIKKKQKTTATTTNTTVHWSNANLPSFSDAHALIETTKSRVSLFKMYDTKCKRKHSCYRIDAADIQVFMFCQCPVALECRYWVSSIIHYSTTHIPICIDSFFCVRSILCLYVLFCSNSSINSSSQTMHFGGRNFNKKKRKEKKKK